ncbi:MAG: hypothetical protein ACFFG0_10380 [Candidatus Thorarchaeota archaeon]
MVEKFESGKIYRFNGKSRPNSQMLGAEWNEDGKMDFCLDGKPHKCNEGNNEYASFFDSTDPTTRWCWSKGLELWKEVNEKIVMKKPTHVVVWEEDRDPAKFFTSEKDATDFIKRLSENRNVKQDSIVLVEIKSVKKITIQKSLRKSDYKI